MPRFGKPDSTGRSSGKHSGRRRRAQQPPKGEPWAWLTRELIASPAWRSRSVNLRRLMDFLLIEHMNHAGTENGHLKATYDQLEAYGLTRGTISKAIHEGELRGLLEVNHGGRWNLTNQPSTFRLTFYEDRFGNPATNEWKRVTEKQKSRTRSDTTVVPQVTLRTVNGEEVAS